MRVFLTTPRGGDWQGKPESVKADPSSVEQSVDICQCSSLCVMLKVCVPMSRRSLRMSQQLSRGVQPMPGTDNTCREAMPKGVPEIPTN